MSQHCDVIFSLIMATFNRKHEIECFIISLLGQTFDTDHVELIIVDQNKENFLADTIQKYTDKLNIIHIRPNFIGSSISRNIGIKNAKGKIISFPDDDCQYYPDTLDSVYNTFLFSENINTVFGQVFDRKTQKNIIRKWPNHEIAINENNFFFLYSCITIFTKNKYIIFDSKFGPNTLFGAYEDADYALSLIKNTTGKVNYSPKIQVNHPKLDISTMDSKKIHSYGRGFGAFCRKNISPYIFSLFLGILTYHLIKLLLAAATINVSLVKKRYISFTSRIQGFWLYKK